MTLWRLEWLRLVRTRRLVALAAVYVFFGLTSAPMARYASEIFERVGGNLQIVMPPPAPIDALVNFTSNGNQLGLLVYVLVIASAVAFDAQREMAVFLRTRVRDYRTLLLPKYAMNVAAGSAAFAVGTVLAWYGAEMFLGSVDAVGVVEGVVLGALYLAFVGAVAAAFGATLNSVVTTAVATLAVAILFGIAGSLSAVGPWLPSHLAGALTDLAAGGDVVSYLRSAGTTIVATGALLALAVRLGATREL